MITMFVSDNPMFFLWHNVLVHHTNHMQRVCTAQIQLRSEKDIFMQILWKCWSGMFLWTPALISSKRSKCFSQVVVDWILITFWQLSYFYTVGLLKFGCFNYFLFLRWLLWYWYDAYCPDMAYEVDWALKDQWLAYLLTSHSTLYNVVVGSKACETIATRGGSWSSA